MNNSNNSSIKQLSKSALIGWCVGLGFVDALIVFGNTMAIVIFTTSTLLRKRTNYFLLSLAIADILVGCISLPLYIYSFISYHTKYVEPETIRNIYLALDIFTGFASIFALAFIALERLYSVALPHWHHTTSSYVYSILIAVVWILASLLAMLRILFSFKIIEDELYDITMSMLFLSLAVICIAYIGIGIKVKMRIREKTKRAIEKDRKLAITLSIVTLVFMVTWLPFYFMNMIFRLCKKGSACEVSIPYDVVYFSKILQYSNSFVNPIIYAFKIPEFRVALLRLIGQKVRRPSTALISLRDIKGSSRSAKKNGNGNDNGVFRRRGESNENSK